MAELSPYDFDKAVRTVWGEAAGEPPEGQQAVAAVIANRAKASGKSLSDVVLAPNQFEPWGARRSQLEKLDPNSADYQRIAQTIRPVLAGEADDPTGGATHFYSPRTQEALGRRPPSWDNGKGFDIGGHRFFNLGYAGSQQGAAPSSGSPVAAALGSPPSPGRSPMADYSYDTAGMSPEEVAEKRKDADRLAGMVGQYRPNSGILGALAQAYAGYRGGEESRSAAEGEKAGRGSLMSALTAPGTAQQRLSAVAATPYGAETAQKIAGGLLAEQLKPPTLGTAGQDAFGRPIPAWIDQANQKITPAVVGAAPPAAGRAGSTAQDVPLAGLTGQDFLDKLSADKSYGPALAAKIKAISEGREQPLSEGRGNVRNQQIMQWVRDYDPGADLAVWNSRKKALAEFNSGGLQSPAAQITAGNTAIKHAAEMSDIVPQLNNADSGLPGNKLYNKVGNWWAEGADRAAPLKEFRDTRERYISEITKFYRGSPGNESDMNRAIEAMDEAGSPTELQAVMRREVHLMRDKVGALQERWKTAMGPAARDFPVLHGDTNAAIDRIEKNYAAANAAANGNAAPAAGVPHGGAPSSQPAAPSLPPGQYVWNAATGKPEPAGGSAPATGAPAPAQTIAAPPAAEPGTKGNPVPTYQDAKPGQFFMHKGNLLFLDPRLGPVRAQ